MMGSKSSTAHRAFFFKMLALEDTVLDSAIELTVSSGSDYNWFIFIYKATIRYAHTNI